MLSFIRLDRPVTYDKYLRELTIINETHQATNLNISVLVHTRQRPDASPPILCPPNLYSAEDKAKLAEAITDIYTKRIPAPLPAFYVVILFIDVKQEDYFVGGKPTKDFVRVVVHHLARQFPNDERKLVFMDLYEAALKPFTKDRGLNWEVEISDEDPKLWRENGIIPPHAIGDRKEKIYGSRKTNQFRTAHISSDGHVYGRKHSECKASQPRRGRLRKAKSK
ncbi:putative oxalocrotonate tautomerase enzyme-domain-containing protein [Mucidula mucida]|nr:putative oxalocrotonate tautomerase enzyme-domain-containing protein [Mucidula mucida]